MTISEKMYQHILENSKDATIIVGFDGNFIYHSPQLTKLIKIESYVINELLQLIHKDDRENVIKNYNESLKQKKLFSDESIEFRILNPYNEYIWLSTSSKTYRNEAEEAVGFIATLRDISERKELEQKLMKSESNYRKLFENIKVGMFQSKIDGSAFINLNNRMAEILGYTKEELLNKKPVDLWINSDDRREMLEELQEKGHLIDYEIYLKGKNGNIITCSVTNMIIKDEKIVEGTLIDITDRKIAEEKLQESEEKFRTIADESLVGIYIIQDGIIKYANEGFSLINEFSVEELIGMSVVEFFKTVVPEQREEALKIAQMKESGEPGSPDYMTFQVFTKSGKRKWVDVYGRTFRYLNKNAILIMARDITEKKQAEEQIKKQNTELLVLNRIITLGNQLDSLDDFLEASCELILDSTQMEKGGIYLYDSKIKHNVLLCHKNIHPDFIEDIKDLNISTDPWKKVFDNDSLVIYEDFSKIYPKALEHDIYSVVIIPLKAKDEYIGSLYFGTSQFRSIKQEEIDFFISISQQIGLLVKKFEAEQQLRNSEEKFRNLFENMSSGVAIYEAIDDGTDFIIKDFNNSAELIEKVKRNQIINKSIKEIFPSVEQFGIFEVLKKVWKTGNPHYLPTEFYKDERISGWRENYVFKLSTGEVVTVYDDITEQKKAEIQLRESEEQFRVITEQSLMGIIIIQDQKIKYINKTVLELIKFPLEILFNQNFVKFAELIHPDDRDFTFKQAEKKQRGDVDYIPHYSIRIFDAMGVKKWIDLYSKPIKYKGKTADLITILDITEKIKAEQRLKESEEKFRLLAEHSLMGIAMIQDNRIIYANRTLSHIFEIPIGELMTSPINEFFHFIHPDDRRWAVDLLRRRLQGEDGISKNYMLRIISRSGLLKSLDVYANAINIGGKNTSLITYIDQTEKIMAEQKIRESEEQFRTISEQALMGIGIIQDGLFKYANETLAKIFEYSVDEILNWQPEEFTKVIHPSDLEFVLEQVRKKQSGAPGVVTQHRSRIISKSKKTKWIENFSKTIEFEGKTANLITMVDMTEQVTAERRLQESEERYRTVTEQALMGIVMVENGLVNYINEAAATILEIDALRYSNRNVMDIFNLVESDKRLEIAEDLRQRMDGDVTSLINKEIPIKTFSNKRKWLDVFAKTIQIQDEDLILITFIEITGKKRAEQYLKESEEKFRVLADQSLIGIIILQDGRFKYVNDAMIQIIGISSNVFLNLEISEIMNQVNPIRDQPNKPIIALMAQEIDKRMAAGQIEEIKGYTIRLRHPSGERKWLEFYANFIKFQEKDALLISCLDVTLKRKAEKDKERLIREITRQNKELMELDKLKDDFFADVSHEFRTPLVAIRGFTELLLAKAKGLEIDQIDDLKTILKNEERLELLVNELLDYSRLKAGRIQFSKDKFTVSEIVNSLKQELDSILKQKQLTVESQFTPDSELIFDKQQIQKVINNLLMNAIKFSNLRGKIYINSTIKNGFWIFSIKDEGIGIKPEDLNRIFIRYGKLKTTEKMNVDGLGIGLAICKRVVESYEGKIWAESDGIGKGATFFFRIEIE